MILEKVPILKGYEIVEKLDADDDKVMYLVDDADGSRLILKALRQTHKFPIYESLAKLTHVNMPKIHKIAMGEDCFYVLEDYVEGQTLQEILETDGVFDAQDAIAIISQLCDVLTYLHNQPSAIIHRDIKPANIMLTDDGTVKLLDFDIAREYKEEVSTDTEVIGTRPFAPPEQYGFSQSDHRTDIYSLGMLITVMLTNSYNVQRIKDLHLKGIAERCTQLSQEKRFQNAKKLKDRLERTGGNKTGLRVKVIAALAVVVALGVAAFVMGGDSYEPLTPNFVNVQTPQMDVFSGYRVWVNVSGGYFDGESPEMLHLDPENFEVTITSDSPAYDTFVLLDSMSPPPPYDSFIFTPVEVHLDTGNRDERLVTVTVRYLEFEETISFPVLAYAAVGNHQDVVVIVDHGSPDGAELITLSRASIRRYAEAGQSLQMILAGGTVLISTETVNVIGQRAVDDSIKFELVPVGDELEFVIASGGQIISDLEGEVRIIRPYASD
ncbi:MAG: serine/threonine protein kinase [Defluviitaleaceae bacterium]|nr:serine/threonine protein kinase [Defluviitaleaceae bacterium]